MLSYWAFSEINNSPEEGDVVVEIKEKKPIFSSETLRNIGYGTLTGCLLFFIIVILCWFIRERMEKDKFKIFEIKFQIFQAGFKWTYVKEKARRKEQERAEREKLQHTKKTDKSWPT